MDYANTRLMDDIYSTARDPVALTSRDMLVIEGIKRPQLQEDVFEGIGPEPVDDLIARLKDMD